MMIQEIFSRKQYPSELLTDDTRRLETQVRTYRKWLNWHLKQANAREVTDVLDIFRDTKNLYYLCKHWLGQKTTNFKEPSHFANASHVDRAIVMLERLYGNEIATGVQATVTELGAKQSWDTETLIRQDWNEPARLTHQTLTVLGLDTLWILIVAVSAGTGPVTNLVGSISSSGSTITRRSLGGHSGSQSMTVNMTSVRTPCIDRWLLSQDERLMAWCVAVTKGYIGLSITNFTHSWRDGLAFLAIVHQSRPELFDYQTRLEKTANQNLSLAFHWANNEFTAPRLLEPVDMQPDNVDGRATATFLLEFRKQVERDRKFRSRGILEIQTPSMQSEEKPAKEQDPINVTVLSCPSPTSTASTSDVTWVDDETDEADELPDPDVFDSTIETTLAWLLAMEERFANNNLNAPEAFVHPDYPFSWTNYCLTDIRQNPGKISPQLTMEERNDIEALINASTDRLKLLHQKILIKVDEAMAHFEVHEDLTAHLSRRQMSVGRCLRLGSRLIQVCRDKTQLEVNDSELDADVADDAENDRRIHHARLRERLRTVDPEAIQRQTALLSSRWNNLCRINHTMDRQMANCLLRRQGMLLIAIRLQLERLESEQNRQVEMRFGPSIRELKIQLEANRNLEEGIEIGEILAVRLDNFVMLVHTRGDGKENADEANSQLLEQIVTELAGRWSRLVDWVNTRFAKLQNALLHWRHFEEEVSVLSDWLAERQAEIRQISVSKTRAENTPKLSLTRSSSIQEKRTCGTNSRPENEAASFDNVQELLNSNDAELAAIEACINTHEPRWSQLLASVDRRAQALREACGDTEEVSRLVETTVDRLVSQWSQLAEPQLSVDDWLDQFSKDIQSTPEAMRTEGSVDAAEESLTLLKTTNSSDVDSGTKPVDQKRSAESLLSVPRSPKISCLDMPPPSPTGYRIEFEAKAEELLNWLDNSAEALELITMDKNRTLESTTQVVSRKAQAVADGQKDKPEVVVKRISREIIEWRETMKRVLSMGERYREELLDSGENVEELDQLFDEVEERWAYLDSLLAEAERHLRVATNSKQFHLEISKLLNRAEDSEQDQSKVSDVNLVKPVMAKPTSAGLPPRDPLDDTQTLLVQLTNQLSCVDELMTSPMVFANLNDLDEQLSSLKTLMADLTKEQARLNKLFGQNENQLHDLPEMKKHGENIKQRLDDTCVHLRERLSAVQEVNEQTEFFMNQLEGIEKWLTEMRYYVDSVSQADLPSVTDLHAQLQESCEALKDMDTLEPTLNKVSEVAKQLTDYFERGYSQIINNRLVELHENWNQVNELINSARYNLEARLTESLKKEEENPSTKLGVMEETRGPEEQQGAFTEKAIPTQKSSTNSGGRPESSSTGTIFRVLSVDIDELEQWMTQAKRKLSELTIVESTEALDSLKQLVKTLNEEVGERRHILAALDTHTAVSLTGQPLSDTATLLTRAHFADLEAALGAERERLRGAIYHLEDFNRVYGGEQRWFESLESALSRVRTMNYTDIMELTDEIETFDRLMEEHSVEDEEHLERLAVSLEEAKIMGSETQTNLRAYKQRLEKLKKETFDVQNELKDTIKYVGQAESTAYELQTLLNTVDHSSPDSLSNTVRDAEMFLTDMSNKIEANHTQMPINRFLKQKLQTCHTIIQEKLNTVKKSLSPPAISQELQSKLNKIRKEIESLEAHVSLLELTSVVPSVIQASMDQAKELLTSMNSMKSDLDQLDRKSKQSGSQVVQQDLVAVQEYHRKVVMRTLMSLSHLEDALTPAQKLDELMAKLHDQVTGIEEVIDYLDTTDCPVSRRYMLRRIHEDLHKLCEKANIIDNISAVMEELKRVATSDSSQAIEDAFQPIKDRINCVLATKEAFQAQLEQINANTEEYISDSCAQPPMPTPDIPLLTRNKPSVSQLIDTFLDPKTPVSDTVRELAREIRDHFKSIVLFNRYCLGTSAPLPTNSSDLIQKSSQLPLSKNYETTVSERKSIVKVYFRFTANHFRQQRTYLGDRLRKLIVNAGDDGTNNRLQDLLNLQTAWHETNDKLDRRGEHMALLEQQLTAAEHAMAEYLRSPTDANRSKCEALIQHLEDTYGWKLTADRERVQHTERIATGQGCVTPTRPNGAWLLEDGLLGKYEFTLRTVAAYLNEIQFCLELCATGNLPELGRLLERLESRFTECYRLLTDAADVLNELVQDIQPSTETADRKPGDRLSGLPETEELIWLKILLDIQKNRLDAYTLEFKVNKRAWQRLAERWDIYCQTVTELNSTLSKLQDTQNDVNPDSNSAQRDLLSHACKQFHCLKAVEHDLATLLEMNPPELRNGISSSDDSSTSLLESVRPMASEQKYKPDKERSASPSSWHPTSIKANLNRFQEHLREACDRYGCQDLLDRPPSSLQRQRFAPPSIGTTAEEDDLSRELEELGPYRKDVEACLNGLKEETQWLMQSSGLVPSGLIKRQSDDILLTSASKQKPTTVAELRLDLAFWHSEKNQSDKKEICEPVEFSPTWVKNKWADLEALIEVTFEHEKQATAWCRKATHLVRLLRNAADPRPLPSAYTKAIGRLESGCNSLSEALNVAQAALTRRRAFLTRWQTDLVELDTLLAEIKSLMSSYEITGLGVKGETPSAWLSDLRHQLTETETYSRATKDQLLAEFDLRNDGLGKYLTALLSSWNKVQENLSIPEQAAMLVRVPRHISGQIESVLREWDRLKHILNIPTEETSLSSDQRTTPIGRSTPIIATVVRAPHNWPVSEEMLGGVTNPRVATGLSGSQVLNQTSPTLSRIRHEVEQLTRWLNAVTDFVIQSKVALGDRFDQETMNRQLQNAQRATSEGHRLDMPQVYHPAALQLKIQQFLTELNARRPQRDRIEIEKDRLGIWDAEEALAADFSALAEQLPQLWNAAEKQMTQRTMELELIIAETQHLKELEREVDRWITTAELDLDGLEIAYGANNSDQSRQRRISPGTADKTLQELLDSVPNGQDKVNQYVQESEDLTKRFRSEDTSKLKYELEQLTDRWNKFKQRLQRIAKAIRNEPSYDDLASETEHAVQTKSKHTSSSRERPTKTNVDNITEKLDNIEQQVTRLAEIQSDLQHQFGGNARTSELTDQRAQVINELQALQGEISQLFIMLSESGTRPSNSNLNIIPDREQFLTRLRELRDKVTTLRQSLQTNSSQNSLFLVRLKELNDWVAHQDAAFRAIVCPLNGNLLFTLKLREMILNLLTDMETKRGLIEDTLEQGRIRYGDAAPNVDSEAESDKADSSDVDDQSKRTVRRIRRHLYHLKQRWLALNDNIMDYKQQLDSVSERLSNFHSLFNDTVEQIRSAHSVTLRWATVQSVPFDRLGSELEQTQTFYEACAPLTVLLNSLDRQITQFHEAQITIDPNVLTEFAALRIDLDHVRSVTEVRLDELNRALTSLQASRPYEPLHQVQVQGHSPFPQDTAELMQGKAQIDEQTDLQQQVPLHDSVSSPWERCVHPSGTQVPYYKNHSTEDTQWDHPILCELMQTLKQLNVVRFAEYRTALKLRKLQKTLCLDSLSISVLAENLKHIGHTQLTGGGPNADPFDRSIYVPQMIDCLTKLFNLSNNDQKAKLANKEPGASLSSGPSPKQDGGDVSGSTGSPSKVKSESSRSGLSRGTRATDNNPNSRTSPIKCGSGFRKGSSHKGHHRAHPRSNNDSSSEILGTLSPSDDLATSVATKHLSAANRSASLPDSATLERPSPRLNQGNMRAVRSSSRSKRRLFTSPTKYPVSVCVDLTLNWLLNVYDRMRKGHIRALSFKVALTTLCMADLVDKYRYLLSLIADTNGHVNDQRLGALLYECILIPRNLGEGDWVGKEDFTNTVKMCYNQVLEIAQGAEPFQNSPAIHSPGVPMRHFITWLRFGTPTLSWLPLLHRVVLAEQVIHNVRCGFCQQHPVVGLRYRCLWCLNFDLCQQCFFSGRISRGHKLTHPMQEYCTNSTSGDSIRDFTRIVRNRLRSRDRLSRTDIDRSAPGKAGVSNAGSRTRGRCCDASKFAEGKPRPAPVYGSDLNSLISIDRTTPSTYELPAQRSSSTRPDSFTIAEPLRSSQQALMRTDARASIGRPMSSQIAMSPRDRGLPPRAATDTRHLLEESRLAERPAYVDKRGRLVDTIPDDEHRLIAQYSQELRQQSEPDLNPPQPLNHLAHGNVIPPLMDRSTISDGVPTATAGILPQGTGHLSLDRKQWNRSPGYVLPYDGLSGYPMDTVRTHGRYTNADLLSRAPFEPQSPYRSARQFGPYPLSSNPALHRVTPYAPFTQSGIQRSYSMRARSQPPPELVFNPAQPAASAHLDSRSQRYPTGPPPQPGMANKMLSLEEERQALQMEYERLRLSPTHNIAYNPAVNRIQAPQMQQRFARSPLHYTVPPQHQDYIRSTMPRTYNPRLPIHRPPSAGPPLMTNASGYSNVATLPGRFQYNGSLGRASSLTNGFNYPLESYGSEPRVALSPSHGFDAITDYGANTTAGSISNEIASEARLLRAHRGRLEIRMQQLEDQNKQLEHKLQRLRQYLVTGGGGGGTSHFGQTTMGSAGQIAGDLPKDRSGVLGKSFLRQRSASGGLTGQLQTADEKYPRGNGSIGHLRTPTSSEYGQTGVRTIGEDVTSHTGSDIRHLPTAERTRVLGQNNALEVSHRSSSTKLSDPHQTTAAITQPSRYA